MKKIFRTWVCVCICFALTNILTNVVAIYALDIGTIQGPNQLSSQFIQPRQPALPENPLASAPNSNTPNTPSEPLLGQNIKEVNQNLRNNMNTLRKDLLQDAANLVQRINQQSQDNSKPTPILSNETQKTSLNQKAKNKVLKAKPKKNQVTKEEVMKKITEKRYALKAFKAFKSLNSQDNDLRKKLMKEIVEYRKAQDDNTIPVFVNGTDLTFDVPPMIKQGRTLIPIRGVTSALGSDVKWDSATRTVTVTQAVYNNVYSDENAANLTEPHIINIIKIEIKVDSKEVFVNGLGQKIEIPATLKDGRVMVPLRFIAEVLKKNVDWEPNSGSVIIDDQY